MPVAVRVLGNCIVSHGCLMDLVPVGVAMSVAVPVGVTMTMTVTVGVGVPMAVAHDWSAYSLDWNNLTCLDWHAVGLLLHIHDFGLILGLL